MEEANKVANNQTLCEGTVEKVIYSSPEAERSFKRIKSFEDQLGVLKGQLKAKRRELAKEVLDFFTEARIVCEDFEKEIKENLESSDFPVQDTVDGLQDTLARFADRTQDSLSRTLTLLVRSQSDLSYGIGHEERFITVIEELKKLRGGGGIETTLRYGQ